MFGKDKGKDEVVTNTVTLGDKVKDTVTGFTGIAVARHTYLTGCSRVSVQPPVDKDGKCPEEHTFDEPMLEVVVVEKIPEGPRNTGGPDKYMPSSKEDGGR